ncbi:hypothetical protein RhiJN_01179 [Ceratobasidium sp. AG-Ba]|nr:hypothetical protein RhiJN_01179 [Ceratobasidium sp. AG-Ba]QRW02208.1 hypothetical protein RhiLY_01205 [Ceratobasidium sp. AG-Ba]
MPPADEPFGEPTPGSPPVFAGVHGESAGNSVYRFTTFCPTCPASSTFRRKRTYYLRSEVEAVKRYHAEISGDQAAVSSWERTQRGTQTDKSSVRELHSFRIIVKVEHTYSRQRAQKTIELIVSIRSNWEEGLEARYAEEQVHSALTYNNLQTEVPARQGPG